MIGEIMIAGAVQIKNLRNEAIFAGTIWGEAPGKWRKTRAAGRELRAGGALGRATERSQYDEE